MQSPNAVAALLRCANQKFPSAEEGQDLLEYGLLAALIAIVAIGAVTAAGTSVKDIFTTIAADLAAAA